MDNLVAFAQNDLFNRQLVDEIPFLRNVAKRFQKNDDDANDLIQDTLYKALKHKNSFRNEISFKSWLSTILKNTFIDHYHRKKLICNDDNIDSTVCSKEAFQEPILYPLYNPSDFSFYHNLSDSYSYAFKSLPSKYKYFIALRDIEGYSYSEIAGVLDCPIGTVRSVIHRARKIMVNTYKECILSG